MTLSISISNYSTKLTKQGQELAPNAGKFAKLFGATAQLKDGGRIDQDGTGFIPCSDTGFFFHMKDFAPAQPVQCFL